MIVDLVVVATGICVFLGSWMQALDARSQYNAMIEKMFPEETLIKGIRRMIRVLFSWHGRWTRNLELNYDPPDELTKCLRLVQSWMLIMLGTGLALVLPLGDLLTPWFGFALTHQWITPVPYGVIAGGTLAWITIRKKRINQLSGRALWSSIVGDLPAAILWPYFWMLWFKSLQQAGRAKSVVLSESAAVPAEQPVQDS